MTSLDRNLIIKLGKHSSTTDFTSVPGTLVRAEPLDHDLAPRDRKRIEREPMTRDNRKYAPLLGGQDLSPRSLTLSMRGMQSNDGGAIASATANQEITPLLDAIFGATATDPSGASTTATGGNGSTPNVTVSSGSGFSNGMMIMFSNGTSNIARMIVSGGGTTTLVLDRTYSGTATGTVIRAPTWALSPTVTAPIHVYCSAEGDVWQRSHFGCAVTGEIDVTDGMEAKLKAMLHPSSITAPSSRDGASYTAPGAGSSIACLSSAFFIGNTQKLFTGGTIVMNGQRIPRMSQSGADGVVGYVSDNRNGFSIKGKLHMGSLDPSGTEFDELVTDLLSHRNASATAIGTFSVALQVGVAAAGAIYVVMPKAAFSGRVVRQNGLEMLDFEAIATRDTAGGAMFSLGVF